MVDASVAVKWYVPEAQSEEAARLLASGRRLLAPDLVVAELGNALWKKVRIGELSEEEAGTIIETFVSACPLTLRASSRLVTAALGLGARFGRTVYDSLYVALAKVEECRFVTADRPLAQAFRGSEYEQLVSPISSA